MSAALRRKLATADAVLFSSPNVCQGSLLGTLNANGASDPSLVLAVYLQIRRKFYYGSLNVFMGYLYGSYSCM
jgi:hypothetical protein